MNINENITAIVKTEITPIINAIGKVQADNFGAIMAELVSIKLMLTTAAPTEAVESLAEILPSAPVEEIPAVTYADLLGNGWTPEQVLASEYAHLAPTPTESEVDEVAMAAQADDIINAAIARMPNGAVPGSYNESCMFHVARQFGKPTIGDVADIDLINGPDKVEAGVLAALESIEKTGSKLQIPPPPPGKSAPAATVLASSAPDTNHAETAAVRESTQNSTLAELTKDAAAGGSIPPAPVFTPGGFKPV
jgi:hypothetical protein